MKNKIAYIVLILPLFTSGCFTAMRHYGEAWSGGSSSSAKAETTALDIVTFPIQAPVVVPIYLSESGKESDAKRRAKKEADANKQFMPLLENDPSLGLNERWDLKNDMHHWIFENSFSNPQIKYTTDLLEKIYQTCPSIRNYVYRCQHCSESFLASHFDEEVEKVRENPASQAGLVAIVSNPNTPLDLVEKVVSNNGLPGGVTMPAEQALYNRGPDVWMPLLQTNLQIALEERWDTKNKARELVFKKSFTNPRVKYTGELLEEIYQTCPMVRDDLYACESCSSAFFSRHFDEEFARGKNWVFQRGIINMISNPNMPIELIEKVASAKPYSATDAPPRVAQRILEKRRSELMVQPKNN